MGGTAKKREKRRGRLTIIAGGLNWGEKSKENGSKKRGGDLQSE